MECTNYYYLKKNIKVVRFIRDKEHKKKTEEQLLQNTPENMSLDLQISVDPSIKLYLWF